MYFHSVPQIYEESILNPVSLDFDTRPSTISSTGAIVAYSGTRYGRSPIDKRVVYDNETKDKVWWGKVNMKISPESNHFCRDLAVKFLNTSKSVKYFIVRNSYVCIL